MKKKIVFEIDIFLTLAGLGLIIANVVHQILFDRLLTAYGMIGGFFLLFYSAYGVWSNWPGRVETPHPIKNEGIEAESE